MLGPYPPFRAVLDVFTAAHYAWSVALQQEAFRTFGIDPLAEPRAPDRQRGEAERQEAKRQGGAPARPRPFAERPVAPAGKRHGGPAARQQRRAGPGKRAGANGHPSA